MNAQPGHPGKLVVGWAWLRKQTAGVRRRLVLVATALVALALAIGAAAMLLILRQALLGAADRATVAKAHEVVAAVQNSSIDNVDRSLMATSDVVDLIQVVDSNGRVILTSKASGGGSALQTSIPEPGAQRTFGDIRLDGGNTEYRGVAIGVSTADGDAAVEVATSEGRAREVVLFVFVLLCAFFPFVLALVMWLVHVLVGRTLKPVEEIRSEVSQISTTDLSARVTVNESGDEIAALAETMNSMLDRLEDSYSRQLQFVGDASHELRSPLVTLVGIVDLAVTTGQPIDVATADQILKPEVTRLRDLITDLLLLASADESGLRLTNVDVDLDDLIDEQVRISELSHGISIDATIVPTRMTGDPQRLSSMIRNILDNAIRYSSERVSVRMSVDDARRTVRVEVSDDGPGIADDAKEHVFDRFVRLDPERDRRGGGTGLGLAIVSEIVRAHHGNVRALDSEFGGTTIRIELPLDMGD